MNLKKIRFISEKLGTILMKPFEFNGLNVTVNYAARAKHAKNWLIAPHYHPWFEFNYVSKGSLYTTINEKEFLINAGDSYIIPPGITHSHRHNDTGDDGLCIRFSLGADEDNPILNTLLTAHAKPFISDIDKINMQGGIYGTETGFLSWLMHLYEINSRDITPAAPVQNTFAAQVTLYLKEYFRDKIKSEDIANAMNTSYRTLARKFAAETGTTVSDTLLKIRLDNAKKLLISTDLPIYKIAVESGFENEFYFSRIFKRKGNITPSGYRSKNKI